MARILKRPMFNRGGSTNEGIMDGLVDRTGFNEGTPLFDKETTAAQVKAMLEAQNEFAPLPKTRLPLGQLGSDLVRGLGFGESAANAYDSYVTADDKRRAAMAGRTSSAVSTSLNQQIAERNAKLKALAGKKTTFAAQTPEAQVAALSKQLADINSGNPSFIRKNSNTIANQVIQFQMAHPDKRFNFKQPTFVEQGGKKGFDPNSIPIGTYFYDVITNTFKLKKADEIVVIDPTSLQEVE